MSHEIFISYSTKDKAIADAVCNVLEENNLRCWIAPRNITSGMHYAKEIMDGLKAAKIVVLVFSKNSQESQYVQNEIFAAFDNKKPIISFKIDETMPAEEMEFFLKINHWLEAYPEPKNKFDRLVQDATRLCSEIVPVIPTVPPVTKPQNRDKDLISIILLITPLYSFSFLYMGYIAKIKEWMALGIIYLIPLPFAVFALGGDIVNASKLAILFQLFIVFG